MHTYNDALSQRNDKLTRKNETQVLRKRKRERARLLTLLCRFPLVYSVSPSFVALAGDTVVVRGVRFEEGCEAAPFQQENIPKTL